jgi:hypothetical protein
MLISIALSESYWRAKTEMRLSLLEKNEIEQLYSKLDTYFNF